jgi:cellulose synthase/poly-beta-1,6-N-acetylglucosamine synthase-like glycosyltransferase
MMAHWMAGGALLLALLTLPGTLTLLLLTLAGLLPQRRPAAAAPGRIALLVPAHDEAAGIGRTLANLRAEARRDGHCSVLVVADNCSDATAAVARRCGARVLERHAPQQRGKGYALDYAFRLLLAEDFAFFIVVDADSVVADGFLAAMRRGFGGGAAALQARYTVLNGGRDWRTALMEVALCGFNVLRPRGRHRLGLSAGLLGNGFGLRRAVLERVPYGASSVVEDLEYHLALVWHGLPVAFVDQALVRAEMPGAGAGARSQRARWEGGRLRLLRSHAPGLLRDVLSGRLRALEPLSDLLLAPLSWQLLALCALLVLAQGWTLALALAGLLTVLLHVLAAAWVGRLAPRQLLVLAMVPVYLLWKLRLLPAILAASARRHAWVRTRRDGGAP